VIGTASAANTDFLRDLGADEAIDYKATRFQDSVREVDVVFDPIGGDTQRQSWQVLKKGGILVSTLGISSPEAARQYQVRGEGVMVQPDSAQLAEIASLIDAGKVNPTVTMILPLEGAARAHELSQTGHTWGKIVLQINR
jgi:NADPH:quinone reductase-like Zn-dependent oxidoreductase